MCAVRFRERTVPLHSKVTTKMPLSNPNQPRRSFKRVVLAGVAIAVIAGGVFSRGWWMPLVGPLLVAEQEAPDDAHAGHDHATPGHAADGGTDWLQLSEQAQKNVGLQLLTVELRDFDRTIAVPAMVIERPGKTRIKVSAPITGIVTQIHALRGEAVTPGQPLFELRLTHEDLVAAQSQYLQTVEQLDVIRREVTRLEKVTASGVIAGKTLLARQYEQQKAEALLHAQRQALILHGLSPREVDDIAADRELLQRMRVVVPQPIDDQPGNVPKSLMQVAELEVEQGQHVTAGLPLCVLTDHAELYLEGKAFEEDAEKLHEAANLGHPITAVLPGNGSEARSINGLKILYVENEVERDSRALRFYVRLPNEPIDNAKTSVGRRFVGWRYKPGQRVELLVPVERWQDRIVLPVDAVVKDGADYYVFQKDGERFRRRPVHVEYRDQRFAVLENDGALFPGDTVVASGAYQIHLALKNKAGGPPDPHAGHQH